MTFSRPFLIYLVVKLGFVAAGLLAFLLWPGKPGLVKIEGNHQPIVPVEITFSGPEGVYTRRMVAGGRRADWFPVTLKRWEAISVQCGDDPLRHHFKSKGGRSTLVTISAYGCADVVVRSSRYP